MAVDIDSLQIEIEATSSDAAAKIDALAAALTNLKTAAKGGAGLTTASKQMQALANVAKLINSNSINTAKLKEMTGALNGLSSIQKSSGLSSTINALKKLPQISESLEKADLGKFAVQMNQVADAMRPLATEMQRVSSGFSAFPIRIQKIIQSNTGLADSNSKAAKSFGVLGTGISSTQAKFGIYSVVFRQIARTASDWVKESNDYVENLNLFTVAMGDAAESALEYAEAVKEAVGIDPSEWIRNQGVFKQITGGFGVMEEKANLMSKNLTQLGYDISSFYNISIEEAMEKLQSGIAGEIEPLRRLGYAIDVATLQEVAYAHGIEQSVNTMNQAQKSQLRYLAIMEQSGNVMGDMARTVQTPANALRILNQQITQLTRALGNLLIPFLQQIIPYVQAFVEVITDAIQALALLVGFELPEIDYSGLDGVTSGATDAEDAIEGATGAAKEMKKALLGIDELTILEPTASGGGGGSGGGIGGDLGLDLPEYDFLAGLEEQASKIKEQMESILGPILSIGAGFAAWKITPKVLNWFKDLKNGKFSKIDKLAAGIGLVITGFTLEWQGGYDIGYNGLNLENAIKTAIGAGLGIAGSLLIFGTGPLGWTIGIVAALSVAIASITIGYNRRQIDDEIKERFGEIELTVEEAKELAERIMSSPLSIQLDMYVETKTGAKEAIEKYLASSEEFSYLIWKVSVGFEVDDAELSNSLDSMIADAQSFLNAQRETYALAVNIGFSDEGIKTEMAAFVNTYFSESSSEMQRLGTELKQTMLDALADGVIDEQEMKTINDLQSEVNQMLSMVADAEYRAKLNNAVYELGGDLSYESVKDVSEKLGNIAQEQLDSLKQTHLDALAVIELKYQTDGNYEEYTAAIENEMQTYFANQAQVSATAFEPLIGKFNAAFSDALTEAQPAFDRPVEDLLDRTFHQFTTDETGVLVGDSISDFMRSVDQQWKLGFQTLDITPEVRAALSETLAALEPRAEQLQKIADDSRAAGIAVPQYVSEGLHDYNMLAAISGDMDAINYLLGEKLSTDPNFLQALQTATDAGMNINEAVANGLLDNLEVKENADGTISLINDTIGEKVLEVTPALKETLKTLGINMSNGLIEGVESKDTEVFNSANGIGKQVGNGIADGLDDSTRAVKNAADRLVDIALSATKTAAKIHSPSRLFRDEVGLNIGLGISEGIGNSRDAILSEIELTNQRMVSAFSTGSIGSLSRSFSVEEVKNINTHTSGTVTVTDGREGQREINQEMISTLFAISQQIISAIEENSGDVYLDGDKVGERVTEYQNRKNRIFGR
ncbi:hypothetical protein H7U40_14600 [Flavonifractor plautii]|uniref:hypothetical protein n=1 Tax=Flavonifractor plautii TaxID=292800 RepID=UPI00195EC053|nr:hypothetical protein [Flavonifractor plautii]MBM6791481.1 hypothetical protein [Flavonifractor plautii]